MTKKNKRDKRLEKFCNPASKQEIPRNDLETLLNQYFPGYWSSGTSGSHIYKVSHPIFKDYPEIFGSIGVLTIPTTGGTMIKHIYVKKLCKAIKLMKEDESEKGS